MKTYLKVCIIALISSLVIFNYSILAEENYEVVAAKVAGDIYKEWEVSFNEELAPESVNDSTVFVKNQFGRTVSVEVNLSSDQKRITVTPSQMYVPGVEYMIYVSGIESASNEVLSPSVKVPFIIEVVEEEKETTAPPPSNNETNSQVDKSQEQQQPSTSKPSSNNNSPFVTTPSTNSSTSGSNTSSNTSSNNSSATKEKTEQKPEHLLEIDVNVNSLASIVTVKASDQTAMVRINGRQMHYQGGNNHQLSIPGLKSGQTIRIEAFSTYNSGSLLERINHEVK